MTITAHDLENEPVGVDLQMLLVGPEKSGKSELAATAPDPVLFLDPDLRASSLAGRKGVYSLSYKDPGSTLSQPTAFNEILDTINQLERSLSLFQLGEYLKIDKFKKVPPDLMLKTVVLDSVTTTSNAARRYVLYTNPKDLAYVINVGQNQYRVPRNWHGWGTEMEMVESAVLRLLGIPNLNVIVTLHEAKEEADDSTEDNPKYTGFVTVFPVRYRILLKYFNEVWRLERKAAGPPLIQCNPNGVFTKASSALRLDGVATANIKQVLEQQRQKMKQ